MPLFLNLLEPLLEERFQIRNEIKQRKQPAVNCSKNNGKNEHYRQYDAGRGNNFTKRRPGYFL